MVEDTQPSKPEFIEVISDFEAERLGLGNEKIVFTTGHVNALTHWMGDGTQRVSLFINDILVQGFDPATQQFVYKVTGVTRHMQPWNTGGAYLDPGTVSPKKERTA